MCMEDTPLRARFQSAPSFRCPEQLLREAEARQVAALRRGATSQDAEAVLARRCRRERVAVGELQPGGRRGSLSAVRAALARELVATLGLSLTHAARHLGVSTAAISKILRKTNA